MQKNHLGNRKTRILTIVLLLIAATTCAHAQDQCSDQSLRGGYGFQVTGSNLVLHVQFATSGRFEADGQGGITGVQTESVGGFVVTTKFRAVYAVNPDCTGSAIFSFPNGAEAHLNFVLVDNGNEAIIIVSDQGTVESGNAKKQFLNRRHED